MKKKKKVIWNIFRIVVSFQVKGLSNKQRAVGAHLGSSSSCGWVTCMYWPIRIINRLSHYKHNMEQLRTNSTLTLQLNFDLNEPRQTGQSQWSHNKYRVFLHRIRRSFLKYQKNYLLQNIVIGLILKTVHWTMFSLNAIGLEK